MSRATDALRRCFLTAGLEESLLETLAQRTQRRHIAADSVVFSEDEIGYEVFIIESGEVRISVKAPHDTSRTLVTLYDGDSFGGLALLDGEKRSATATAVTDTSLVALHRDDFIAVVHGEQSALDAVLHSLADMVRTMNRKLIGMGDSPPRQVAQVLLDYHERHGAAGEIDGTRVIKHPLSIGDVASETGLPNVTVERILSEFQYRSVIERGPEFWTILRMDDLEDAASSGHGAE